MHKEVIEVHLPMMLAKNNLKSKNSNNSQTLSKFLALSPLVLLMGWVLVLFIPINDSETETHSYQMVEPRFKLGLLGGPLLLSC